MNLDRVIAVRTNKTVYRDGDKCIKVFDSDYSKADVLNEALNQARIEGVSIYFKRANTVYECACETADMRLIYGRRISSESKIICKADLREVQGH